MAESDLSKWEAELAIVPPTTYVPPPPGSPLELWRTHPLFNTARQKANGIVASHGADIAHNEGRLAETVRRKTGKTDWTKEEARAFLRGRCGFQTQTVMLSILEAYEYGRCVPDCKYCKGASFKDSGGRYSSPLNALSIDIYNPRSSLPRFGHATGWRCPKYNTSKRGRCLDEYMDHLDVVWSESEYKSDHKNDPESNRGKGKSSQAEEAFRKSGTPPKPYDERLF